MVDSLPASITVVVKSLPKAIVEVEDTVTLDLTNAPPSVRVRFDGRASHDPDDGTSPGLGIARYTWNFGDGSALVEGTDAHPWHTYTATGTMTGNLVVLDNDGFTGSTAFTVMVSRPSTRPEAIIEVVDSANQAISSINLAPAIPNHEVSVTFKGEKSHDPDDGTQPGDGIEVYSWLFGDGETSDSANVTRRFSTTGAVTGTLTVTDNEDVDSAPAAVTVTVKSLPKIVVTGGGSVFLDPTSNSAEITLRGGGSHDPDDVEVTVIDVQINLPVHNAKLVLPTMEVQGTPLPAEISSASTISWEIIIGTETHTTSTQGLAKDTLVVHPFPLLNSNFGLNKVVATLNYKTGSVTREQPVRLFFDKDGVLLDSDWPNWYRFWSQTPANIGPHVYDPTLVHFGEYKFALGEPHFYIGRAAGGSIDDFGTTCVHEDQHRKDWKKWRGDPHGYYVQTEDMDLDWVPDSEEPGLGFVVGMVDSDRDNIDDVEESAEIAELTWTLQSTTPGSGTKRAQAYEQDWSERGKQW